MRGNVLIVEPDSQIVRDITKLLELYDVNILYAPDLSLSQETINSLELSLILIDCNIPNFENRSIFDFIKKSKVNKKVFTISMTDDLKKCKDKGFSGILKKPLNPNEFHKAVSKILKLKR